MAINAVFVELIARTVRKKLGVLVFEHDDERDASDTALDEHGSLGQAESSERITEQRVINDALVADSHVQYVDRLIDALALAVTLADKATAHFRKRAGRCPMHSF